jgi:hypothetical protein
VVAAARNRRRARLERYGYRSYSQNDEDGILQEVLVA